MKKGKKNLKIDVPVDIYSLEKHLCSLMFSGVYVSNVDIRNLMKKMGYDAFELSHRVKVIENGKKRYSWHSVALVIDRKTGVMLTMMSGEVRHLSDYLKLMAEGEKLLLTTVESELFRLKKVIYSRLQQKHGDTEVLNALTYVFEIIKGENPSLKID